MTDKQIIIDGVDVSGCGELYNGCCCDNGSLHCKDQPNCKFKLEKRGYKLEQITEFTPREELLETITHLRVLNAELESYNEQLEEGQNIEIKENKFLREQLKRKEQELQEAMDNYVKLDNQRVKEYNELVNRYTAKEQECEKLKKDNNCFQDRVCKLKLAVLRLTDDNDLLKAENNELEKAYARLNSLYNDNCNFTGKLEQTLTEIKEIIEQGVKIHDDIIVSKQILQKISEVIE